MKYNRRNIMRRAHALRLETGRAFGECLRQSWAEAKSPKNVAIAPQRLPLEAAVIGAYNLAKRLKDSRIEVAGRISVDLGLRITPKGYSPMAYVVSKNIAGGFDNGKGTM